MVPFRRFTIGAAIELLTPGSTTPVARSVLKPVISKPNLSLHVDVSQNELDATSGNWTARISNATLQALPFTTILSYVEQDHHRRWQERPEAVMSYYHAEHVTVYDVLARHFTVCDHWFASIATDTWPNRLFALTGGSGAITTTPSDDGVIDNPPGYTLTTIFEMLQDGGVEWGFYFSDAPFALVFQPLAQDATFTARMRPLHDFYDRAATGELPPLTWIDPNFTDIPDDSDRASDDHPPGDIARRQALVAEIYSHLITSPAWPKTLFIIVYDEHGGFYDHRAPEPAVDDPHHYLRPSSTGAAGVTLRLPQVSLEGVLRPHQPAGHDPPAVLPAARRQLPYMGTRVKLANDVGSALTASPTTFEAPAPPMLTAGVFVPSPPTDWMSFGTVLHTALFGFSPRIGTKRQKLPTQQRRRQVRRHRGSCL